MNPDYQEVQREIKKNGLCKHCNKINVERGWCSPCDRKELIEFEWTSGNPNIDNFIRETQANADNFEGFLELIDFDGFQDIKEIGVGGFGKVYSATWVDGCNTIVEQDGIFYKTRSDPFTVALKNVKGSKYVSDGYLNEMRTYYTLSKASEGKLLKFYGITENPTTKEFLMVTDFADTGDLRRVLSNSFDKMLWKDKLHILFCIIQNLENLHKKGYCHKDFHSGNILRKGKDYYLSDFGLTGPANKSDDKVYGVLSYVAPEVLRGKPYSKASDIYSFGVIMAEISSGQLPYKDQQLDNERQLAISICNGLRPGFGKDTPDFYEELALQCMNANPELRPTAEEVTSEIFDLWFIASEFIRPMVNDDLYDEKKLQESQQKVSMVRSKFGEADEHIPNIKPTLMNYDFDIHKSKQLDILDPISIEAYGIIDSCQVNMHLSTSLMDGLNIDGDDNE